MNMSDNPSSPLLGAKDSDRPSSQRSQNSTAARNSNHSEHANEASPLLGTHDHYNGYGDAPEQEEASSAAASSLRSLQNSNSAKKRSWRWPSIIAWIILSLILIVILGLGFATPAVAEEYAKEATVFEPTSLSIDSFTSTGVLARIQGDFRLDGSRVHKKAVRDLGRLGTWIARAVQSRESHVKVYLPQYDDLLLGTATIPPVTVNVRDGVTTHVDLLADLAAGDLDGLRHLANDWIGGRIGELSVRGVAKVPLKSGIFRLGTQSFAQTLVFKGDEVPAIPQYKIERLNFHEAGPEGSRSGMAADVSAIITNDYPIQFDVPPLGFNILVPACEPDQPRISLADAVTKDIHIRSKEDVRVEVVGLLRDLPDRLTSACPEIQKSPLDLLVGGYVSGAATTVYVRGSDSPAKDTPPWVAEFMRSIVLPVDFQGKSFDNLIRNFSLADVNFALPNPFSGPDSPDSKPRVSAIVKALVALPEEMNFDINIPHVRASSEIYYQGKKLGNLDLSQWQKADSQRIEAHDGEDPSLAVSSVVKEAPIDITDEHVFAEVVQAMLFGGKDLQLDIQAAVDVETKTVLGEFVVRDIPAKGKVFVKPLSGDDKNSKFDCRVGSLRILDTTASTITLSATVNVTNPTNYSATVPYANIKLFSNGSELGSAWAHNISVEPGKNYNIPVESLWDPVGPQGIAQGRELLSQYTSGFDTNLTLKTHAGTIPTQPMLGLALSNFSIDLPTPALQTPRNPSKPDDDRDPRAPSFIDDATFHIFTSTASFTLLSPLPTTSIFVTWINATAYYNHTEPVGGILYELPWEVPPGVSISPKLPVDYDLLGVGYGAVKDALGGRLQMDAKADVTIKVGRWEQSLWVLGRHIGASIRL